MKPWLFSVSVKPVPFLRLHPFWTESHIAGDGDTGKRLNARSGPGPSVDSRPNQPRDARSPGKTPSTSFTSCASAPQILEFAEPDRWTVRPPQAAAVISAACHITQTKPPHDASDNASRTQRAMTASLACSGNVLCCRFVPVKLARDRALHPAANPLR